MTVDQVSEMLRCVGPDPLPAETVAVRSIRAIASLVERFGGGSRRAWTGRRWPATIRVAGRFWRVSFGERQLIFDLARGLATETHRPEIQLAAGPLERVMRQLG